MGCVSSKILTKSASFREEFQKQLQRRKTGSYEEVVISKTIKDQFLSVLSTSNTVPNKLNTHESSNQPSITNEETKSKLLAENEVEEPQEEEQNIEIINKCDLLAGLEDDINEVEVEKKEELSKNLNTTKDEKGLRRKAMAKQITNVKVPKFEFSRTGSLRDWLSHGGQAFSPGSYVTPRFGSFQTASVNGSCEENENVVFDPKLLAQLEEAMEEMSIEEEEMLRKIV